MSRCITGTCPHERGVFIWLPDGPWRGDPADPDYNRYPWVHNTTMIPGHLTVCDLMPFATAIEAGEAPMTTGAGTAVLANLRTAPVRDRVPFNPGPSVQLSLFDDATFTETPGGAPVTAGTPENASGTGVKAARDSFPMTNPLAPPGPAAFGPTCAPGRVNRAEQHDQHRARGRRR
jgi:hypothetical protein